MPSHAAVGAETGAYELAAGAVWAGAGRAWAIVSGARWVIGSTTTLVPIFTRD